MSPIYGYTPIIPYMFMWKILHRLSWSFGCSLSIIQISTQLREWSGTSSITKGIARVCITLYSTIAGGCFRFHDTSCFQKRTPYNPYTSILGVFWCLEIQKGLLIKQTMCSAVT